MTAIPSTATLALELDWSDDEDTPPNPDQAKYETALIMLSVDREFLAGCESGIHTFNDRVELKTRMIDLTRKSIARYEHIVATFRAGQSIARL